MTVVVEICYCQKRVVLPLMNVTYHCHTVVVEFLNVKRTRVSVMQFVCTWLEDELPATN
jgi:hypothetical protein